MINTKYLDNEIELLNSLERNQELTEYGENKLTSFKEIKKQLTLIDVGCSLKILCKDLNLDPESVLLEYCNTENGFEVFYDEGIEETYLVKKGFIQL